jgi:hypothetical protein
MLSCYGAVLMAGDALTDTAALPARADGLQRRLTVLQFRVEVLEAVHLVDPGDGVAQVVSHLAGRLEAEVRAPGPDVEQQVARRGRRVVHGSVQRPERVKFTRPRTAGEEPSPGIRSDADDADETVLRGPERRRADHAGQILEQVAYGPLAAVGNRADEEDGCAGGGCDNGLRNGHEAPLARRSSAAMPRA